jgi:hypothetical protein
MLGKILERLLHFLHEGGYHEDKWRRYIKVLINFFLLS